MELYCLHYNNYYNRIIKKEDTINGYLPYLLYKAENINFNPNDGVDTTQILNWNVESMPDYIVAVNGNDIISRWFIIEMSRTRTGQYSLILRRDLIADNYEPIINAPCFIEKATLNQDDPMIYNSEDMSFNQIKTSETLLKDKSEVSWIVGYYAKDYKDESNPDISLNLDSNDNFNIKILPDIDIDTDITEWKFYKYTQYPYFITNVININYSVNARYNTNTIQQFILNGEDDMSTKYINNPSLYTGILINTQNPPFSFEIFQDVDYTTLLEKTNSLIPDIDSREDYNELINLNTKIIKYIDSNNVVKYKKIKVTPRQNTENISLYTNEDAFNYMSNAINPLIGTKLTGEPSYNTFYLNMDVLRYIVTLEDVNDNISCTTSISKNNRYNVNDQPYSMFAIPYGNLLVKNSGNINWNNITTSYDVALRAAYAFSEKYSGSGTLYDIQLLPYCPMQGIISDNNVIDLKNDSLLYSTINIQGGDTVVGIIINCTDNTFSLNIPLSIDVIDKKIENLTDMHRICSPNMNGAFEFSVAKNNGIDYINVDCEYRPYTPYIHLNPNFKGLYGQDFNGARGLICAGDFSLTQINDAWQTYQIQNKNYENIFNRQIQNMQVNNAVQKEKEIWSAAAGAIGAGTSGAVAGGMIGGPIGAVVGGLVSGGISAAAGARDIALNKQLRAEAIDYTKDQYGYQLGNIMALPDSITKVSSFNPNNKIFPFIEYYTCTDIEKEALRNKLKYNGMTVMRIGNIREFLQTEPSYIKGKLIRLEDISDEYHIVNEIANEIYKGVFI